MEKGNEIYHVIGAMAGSSMDGFDLTLSEIQEVNNEWRFRIHRSETIGYPAEIYDLLKHSAEKSNETLHHIDEVFGTWIGKVVNQFIGEDKSKVSLLAVHGHTVVHQPHAGISWQLGHGQTIANTTKLKTVTDFRSKDVKLGGQGAPLVPFGDFILFNEYDACLNLGGIANVSIKKEQTAWDICPCNQVLNYYASKLSMTFDKDGAMSRKGQVRPDLTKSLVEIEFFKQKPPKSLPNNFIDHRILDVTTPIDGLRTYSEFIADQIEKDLNPYWKPDVSLLITGGGAHNLFLIELVRQRLKKWNVIVPSQEIIDFKEALIFGFLGLKCLFGETNVLASVTGGSKDTCSGVIHLPK